MANGKQTRRQFLTRGAAAMAAPYILTSAALGKPAASDRVAIGAIGPGRRGGGLLRGAGRLGQIVAAADVHLARARKAVGGKGDRAFQDYRKMLELKDLDAVIVSTPDHWHALASIHACQAGKHVYVEKPMTLTIREGRLMVQAARKHNCVVQCGSQQRSMAKNRLGCELVRNGRLGKIKKVIAHNYPSPWLCGLPGQPVPEGLDWDMWCGPTEVRPYHIDIFTPRRKPGWISFRTWSGGEMTGWGAHGFDQIQWALGMDDSGPVEIWTEGPKFDPPTYTKPEGRGRGDKACSKPTVFMKYPGDIVMELGRGPHGGGTFIGEKGTIRIDRGRLSSDPPELAKEPLTDPEAKLYVSKGHMRNWLECTKTGKRPVADVEIGHRSSTVCHLGNIARWLGRRVKWDPEKEEFVGDDEANTYLDRTRRKPYMMPETL
ncbi:MAG: Gfo/Idh/MocA family protein [Planctomycetota bacterium]